MDQNRGRYLRFREWNLWTPERQYHHHQRNSFWIKMQEKYEDLSDKIKSFVNWVKSDSSSSKSTKNSKNEIKEKKILDPQGSFLQIWNKIFVLSCLIAVAIDPLFFYIPVINGARSCFDLDRRLEIIACVLRSCIDIFYILHIVFQFRTGFIAPSSRVFGRGELVVDASVIAKRYLYSNFVIDVMSILPIPQAMLIIIPNLHGPTPLLIKEALKYTVFIQYIPRCMRIHPLYSEVTRTSGIFAERAWTGAAFNLILYMLASHIIGAFWYLFSIERRENCWHKASKGLEHSYKELYCESNKSTVNTFLNGSCPLAAPDSNTDPAFFNFGIFLDAFQSGVVESNDFPQKFFYCFWWGLRNLSSLGQNLKTSTYVGEITFAIAIAIFGLLLFALLIGNMQTYLQSTTVRVEEMRVKRRDADQWMSHRMLPETLRERVRRYEQYKWQETRGVEEDRLIQSLPKDLRRDIKRHLCLALLMRVPMFEKMDEQLLDAMCDRLKPVLYTEKSFILREGDPVDEMLFLMRGNSVTMTTNGGKTGFFNMVHLKAGDFCGEELLTWALDPNSSSNLPTSTRTVQAETEVEAFGLMSEDLKFVASQYRRLHNKQLRHTFKFYSSQWRTWAACFIQAVWRRHCKRKLEKKLHEEENRLRGALVKETEASTSLGAAIYASKFASNMLKSLRRNTPHNANLQPKRVMPLLPSKPLEPDFTP